MERMRAVIAEITAENLELIQIVERTKRRSGWRAYRTLATLDVQRSVFYAWKKRENREDRAGKRQVVPGV